MTGSFYDGQISPTMPRDVELALGYFQKSAAQGYRPAQYNLATLLLSDQARDEPKVALLSLLSTPLVATSHVSTRGDGITHVRVVSGRHLRCSRNWPRAETRRAC
jgi:TPR repeat protein